MTEQKKAPEVIPWKQTREVAPGGRIAEALLGIGNVYPVIEPDAQGPYGGYVSLAKIRREVQSLLHHHGLSIIQLAETGEGGAVAVRTIVRHLPSGETMESVLQLAPERGSMQSYGAPLSYIRRYALQALIGFASGSAGEDLDAMRDPTEGEAPARAVAPAAPSQAGAVRLSYEQATGKNNKPYFRFKTTDGRRFNLFGDRDAKLLEAAKSAADKSLPVDLEFKQDGKWLELIAIEPAGNPEETQEFTTDEIPF